MRGDLENKSLPLSLINNLNMDSFAVTVPVVSADMVERALIRAELLQGSTVEDLILDEISDLQRDLIRVMDP